MTKEKFNLGKALKDLEKIATWFDEQEEVDVEKGMQHVRDGATLIKKTKKHLQEVENEFEEIKKSLEE